MNEEDMYITTEDVVGHPECPEIDGTCPPMPVAKGTVMELICFSEYTLQFKLEDGSEPCFSRERTCDDVSDPSYYENYFNLPKGIDKLKV